MRGIPIRVWNSIAIAVLGVLFAAMPFVLMARFDYNSYVAKLQETEGVGAMEARNIFWSDYFGALLSEQALHQFVNNLSSMASIMMGIVVLYLIASTVIALDYSSA